MPVLSLGLGAGAVVDLSQFAVKAAGNVFTVGQTFQGGDTFTNNEKFYPTADVVAVTLRAGVLNPTSPLLAVAIPGGTSARTAVQWTGAVYVNPFGAVAGTTSGTVLEAPTSTVANGGSPVAAGAAALPLSAPVPNGTYVVDSETVTVTGCTGTAAPFSATLAANTSASHAHGAVLQPQNAYALELRAARVSGGAARWLDNTGAQQGRITGTGAVNVATGQSVFGSLSAIANTALSAIATAIGVAAFRARRFSSGQTADILTVEDESGGLLSRFNKAGRFTTKVAAAPVLADLTDGEVALSVDPATGNLIVTARISGALKTATITVT